ncbi:MAG: IPT/TIG domain-containing protein, partial [Acidobacteriota bacterium]
MRCLAAGRFFLLLLLAVPAIAHDVTLAGTTPFVSLDGSSVDHDGTVDGIFTVTDGNLVINGVVNCNDDTTTSACAMAFNVSGDLTMNGGSALYAENRSGSGTGGTIALTVGGKLTLNGNAIVSTASKPTSGSTGGAITATVTGDVALAAGSTIDSGSYSAAGGAITIASKGRVTVDGRVLSGPSRTLLATRLGPGAVLDGGTANTIGGAINISSSSVVEPAIVVGASANIVSQGADNGAGPVTIDGCGVQVDGLIAALSQKESSGSVRIRSGKNILIDGRDLGATGLHMGRLRADAAGGTALNKGVDLFAAETIDVFGPASGSLYLITSLPGIHDSKSYGGLVRLTSLSGAVNGSGKLIDDGHSASGDTGGRVLIAAKGNVSLPNAAIRAHGDFNTNNTNRRGGSISIRSHSGSVTWTDGLGEVRPVGSMSNLALTDQGTIVITACGAIQTHGTVFPVEGAATSAFPGVESGVCSPAAPVLPAGMASPWACNTTAVGPPTVTSVSPRFGAAAGATPVNVVGTGFVAGDTEVYFGTSPAAALTSQSPTAITATTPAGSGTVNVQVVTDTGADTLANAFTYVQPPAVTSSTPAKGATAGNQPISIDGTNFVDGETTVSLDGAAATSVQVLTDSRLNAVTPAHPSGAVEVAVTTPGGSASLANGFRYVEGPIVTGFNPAQAAVGQIITVTGQNFDTDAAGTIVSVGGVVALVNSITPTQAVVTIPVSAATGRISVMTAGGATSSAADFVVLRYTGVSVAPSSASLSPGSSTPLTAFGVLPGGGTEPLSSGVIWTSSNSAVATVTSSGVVNGIAEGSATITATDPPYSAVASILVASSTPVPPDPSTIAPPLPGTGGASLSDGVSFLYTGAAPIQTGVAAGTIEARRVAVVRGFVATVSGAPLAAARVTIADRPEFGSTLSRGDGRFDLAVNGGEVLTVRVEKSGHLSADRYVKVPWQDFVAVDAIRLVALDPAVNVVTSNSSAAQIARGSVVTDSSGTRRATMIFLPGTGASMKMADDTAQPLGTLNVRATEYSVGTDGATAMPASLPPQSAYTYCVEFSVDEARTAGARSVDFSQPVPVYVENFLGFSTGTRVPSAFYDASRRIWVPTPDGRVIRIQSIEGSAARVDTDGDGAADDIGMTLIERQQLAILYAPSTSLWRVPVTHFTPYDWNFPVIVAPGGALPNQRATWYPAVTNSCEVPGSIIECENQTLGEAVGVTGTSIALHYRSDRTLGRVASRTLEIPLTGAVFPPALLRVEVEVAIAGQFVRQTFAPSANLQYRFEWDSRDGYGRLVNGARPFTARITHVYPGEYQLPAEGDSSFGRASGISMGVSSRLDVNLTQTLSGTLGSWVASGEKLGNWTLTPHHFYDAAGKTLYRGDGTRRTDAPEQFGALPTGVITRVAGTSPSDSRPLWSGIGGPATSVKIDTEIEGILAAPDGSVYVAFPSYLRKITTDGRMVHVAGNGGIAPSSGPVPPVPAATSPFYPAGMSFGPDGSLYVAEPFRGRVRRIDRDGMLITVAHSGLIGPKDVAVAPDGSIYICDSANRIFRIAPDGVMAAVAGTGAPGSTGDGGPAVAARIDSPQGIALAPDGNLYILERTRVRRLGTDGIIYAFAGTTTPGYSGDGGPALSARVAPFAVKGTGVIAMLPDGSVVFEDAGNRRVRRVDPNGIISTIAGTGEAAPFDPDTFQPIGVEYGRLARATTLDRPVTVAAGIDGGVYVVGRAFETTIGRTASTLLPRKTLTGDDTMVADGALIYVFDPQGRHLRTISADTGATLLTFSYAAGLVTAMTDHDGNVTAVERDPGGYATAIIAPGGQRTELTQDPPLLKRITPASGEATTFTYTPAGLMLTMTDPRSNTTSFTWNELGLLRTDRDAEGGTQTMTRTQAADGYAVAISTVGGRTKQFVRSALPNADSARSATSPSGLTSNTVFAADGRTTVVSSEGMQLETRETPDPAWGMQAPFTGVSRLTWPSGRVLNVTGNREVTLEDPDDPLTIRTRTDRVSVNGKTTMRVFNRGALTETVT